MRLFWVIPGEAVVVFTEVLLVDTSFVGCVEEGVSAMGLCTGELALILLSQYLIKKR